MGGTGSFLAALSIPAAGFGPGQMALSIPRQKNQKSDYKHILIATDAPKEMGFTLSSGNNMHINLEPETREETERIFAGQAEVGTITMSLKDMFFGAYYGSITDR